MQGHINQCARSADRRCRSTVRIILAPNPAWLIEMCVGIDYAREGIVPMCINLFVSLTCVIRQQRDNSTVLNGKISLLFAIRRNEDRIAYQ